MASVRFGAFQLNLATGELRKDDTPVRLQPQPLKVLAFLAGRPGELVSRDDIRRQIWPDDTFVDFDHGLNYCIRQIRRALGDDADRPRFVETVPRLGYRFVAPIESVPHPADERAVLVVLPFHDLSGDPEQEYFSDGLTEEMIAQLGRLNPQRLGVIARTSAMRYKHVDKSIDAIGRELGVSHVLEGSVRRSGNRVRVTAQLIQTRDQTQLWSHSFERPLGDIIALQRDVTGLIATEIGVQLSPEERLRFAVPRSVDSGAFEAYLRGRHFWKRRSRDALQKSVAYFEQAISRDATYAPAYAGLADVHLTQLDYNYVTPRDAFVLADRALLDALRLDNTLAEPHTSLGHLRLHQFDWQAAAQQFRRAIELNPSYDTAHYYYSNLLAALGRFDDAIAEADRALALDPLSPNAWQNRLFILYLARRYDEALERVDEIFELDPSYTALHYYLGQVFERRGEYTRAIEAFQKLGSTSSRGGSSVLAAIGYTHAKAGRLAEATNVLKQLAELSKGEYVSPYDIALLHLALGNTDEALAMLSAAYQEHASFLPFVNVDARFDELSGDPRFRELVRRLEFPDAV